MTVFRNTWIQGMYYYSVIFKMHIFWTKFIGAFYKMLLAGSFPPRQVSCSGTDIVKVHIILLIDAHIVGKYSKSLVTTAAKNVWKEG